MSWDRGYSVKAYIDSLQQLPDDELYNEQTRQNNLMMQATDPDSNTLHRHKRDVAELIYNDRMATRED